MKKIELITKKDLEIRLKKCLEQKIMPDYFLYLDHTGVKNWLSLDNSKEFPIAAGLTELLKKSLSSLSTYLVGGLSLVSIGVGSGEKERILLEALHRRGFTRYYAVDISSRMIDQALARVADIEVEKTGLVALLEDLPYLRKFWTPPVLLCFMGNTFCNCDPDYLLAMIYEQIGMEDLFLFDCHLFPNDQGGEIAGKEQVEKIYRSKQNIRFNIGPLADRGLSPDDCTFYLDLSTNETSHGVIRRTNKQLRILRDTTVWCDHQAVSLLAGDTIQLGFTYKYTCPQIHNYLDKHGFEEIIHFLSTDGNNLLTLIRKRPL